MGRKKMDGKRVVELIETLVDHRANTRDVYNARQDLTAFFDRVATFFSDESSTPTPTPHLVVNDTTRIRKILRMLAEQSARAGWYYGDDGVPPERGAEGEDAVDVTAPKLAVAISQELETAVCELVLYLESELSKRGS